MKTSTKLRIGFIVGFLIPFLIGAYVALVAMKVL